MKKFSFFSDGFSIDETKTSMLILALVISLGVALVYYGMDRSIGDNLTSIITTLILTIGGVNAVNSASSILKRYNGKNENDDKL